MSELHNVTYTATIENDNASEYTFAWTVDGTAYDGDNAGEASITLHWGQGNHTVKCTATKGSTVLEEIVNLSVTVGIYPEFELNTTGFTVRCEIDPGNVVTSIDWGDNNVEDVPANTGEVQHTYATEGTYTVTAHTSQCERSKQITVAEAPSFTCGNTMTDADNNTYRTVQIGSQCWMAENLRSTHYSDGTTEISGKKYPNGAESNVADYGYLYNWNAVMNGANSSSANPSGVQGICPTGWHVPSKEELCSINLLVLANGKKAGQENGSNGYNDFNNGFYVWSATLISSGYAYYSYCFDQSDYSCYQQELLSRSYSVRCVKDADGGGTSQTNPTVTTGEATSVTDGTATLSASITNPDNVNITAKGFEYKVTTNGTYAQVAGTETGGTMTAALTGLTANTSYTYRAFITFGENTVYGSESMFSTQSGSTTEPTTFICGTSTVSDYDGNEYNTVQIGSQCWMAENLRSTHYSDGNAITYTSGTNGNIYNWFATMKNSSTEGGQGVCPTGWHVPSQAEYQTMKDNNGISSFSQQLDYWTSTSSDEYDAFFYTDSYSFLVDDKGNYNCSVRCLRDSE